MKRMLNRKWWFVCAAVLALLTVAVGTTVADTTEKCAAYENFAGREPAEILDLCGGPTPQPAVNPDAVRFPTDTGFAQDLRSDSFVSFTLNDFPNQVLVGINTDAYYGMDFDPSATTLWALNDTTGELGTINLATGAFTGVVAAPAPTGNWTGLAIDASGTFWASDVSDLYTIDPGTGVSTLVGPFGISGGLMIEVAINLDGDMYGHDIATDSIYSIDTATGAATLIGPTGLAANFAQGMDFDFSDGTLYIFGYTGGGTNTFGTVDLATGAVTPLAVDDPLGEFEGAIQVASGESLSCNGPTVEFEDGIPGTWTNLDNGGPFAWVTTADPSVSPNETGGAGEAATADSDAFGGSGIPFDAELWTNSFSLAGASNANLDMRYRHRDIGDTFDVDISTDGGSGWTNVFNSTDPNPGGAGGDPLSVNLTPYAGEADVMARFRYYGTGWLWYAQVDQLSMSCTVPAITLTKTVGTTPAVCAATTSIVVGPGTDVYYCYTVENTGTVTFGTHDLVDSELGILLDDFVFTLNPGGSTELISPPVTINSTVTNTATWTAFNVGAESASDDAQATVTVLNDQCDDAVEIRCPGGGGATSYLGTTNGATFTDQGTCTTSHTAPEVWYHIVGNGGDMTVDTCVGTSYDTKITVWSGSCGALSCVDGNDDDCGLQSLVTWPSTVGVDYYVMVHGFSSNTGDFELTLTCTIPVELQSFDVE